MIPSDFDQHHKLVAPVHFHAHLHLEKYQRRKIFPLKLTALVILGAT